MESDKVEAFIREYKALLAKHDVQIHASCGEAIAVFPDSTYVDLEDNFSYEPAPEGVKVRR